MTECRQIVLQRLDYLSAELAALRALVAIDATEPPPLVAEAPTPVVTAPEGEPAVDVASRAKPAKPEVAEDLPPEPEWASAWDIDPEKAAKILGVVRQTVDRRLKDQDAKKTAWSPRNVSKGDTRARWRFRSESQVKEWWSHVK